MKLLTSLATLVVLLSWVTNSLADLVEIQEDWPSIGDTTTTTYHAHGTSVTTSNLISENWIDGSWVGTMFPDSSDLSNESLYLTGKDGTYAQTTLSSQDYFTLQELQGGFTSVFGVQARWWNSVPSTFTMTQIATTSNGDSTTQILLLEDTTNHNYQFYPYQNTLIVNPSADIQHGTLTARFDFDILDDTKINYNGGHAGVDLKSPSLNVSYNTYTNTVSVDTVYCYEKVPNACPGNDEIVAAEELIESIDVEEWIDIYDPNEETEIFNIPDTDITYFEYEYEEDLYTYEEDTFNYDEATVLISDDYFDVDYFDAEEINFEPNNITVEENLELEIEFETNVSLDNENELPLITLNNDTDPYQEEEFNQEEFIETYEPTLNNQDDVSTGPIDEPTNYSEDNYVETNSNEEIAMVEEPILSTSTDEETYQEETPIQETYQEEVISEEVVEENAIENESPITEEPIAEQPQETADVEEPVEQPEVADESVEEEVVELEDTKVVQIEKAIADKITNVRQKVEVTLSVVSEILNRDIIQQEVSLASYNAINESFFENQLDFPDGNMDFFKQIDLVGYDYEIYQQQVSLSVDDPVTAHEIKKEKLKIKTEDAYKKLMELKNANNI